MGHLADRIADLAEVPSRAAKRVSRELGALLQEDFDAGHDPYGTAWKRLAPATIAKGRTPPPLSASEKMRRSLRVKPMRGAGIAITISHPAQVHQTGWDGPSGKGPARPILPQRGELPEAWIDVIESGIRREARS
jgi:hypothetical protein